MDALALGLCALGAVGLFSNGLIFALLYRKQSMRTFSNRFVLSLAASHLLQCLLVIPAMTASALGVAFPRLWCRISDCLTVCLNLASIFSIVLIAVDRNCAVNSPLHYALTITRQRATGLICAAWATALALAAPRPALPPFAYSLAVAAAGFALPFANVAGLYLAMFRAARDNSARRSSSNSSGSSEVIVNLKKQGVAEYTIRRNFSNDRVDAKVAGGCCRVFVGKHKAAVTGLMVVLSFITCWTPYFAAMLFEACFSPLSSTTLICVHMAAYSSCVLNPYIYFFRNKNAWKECKKLLKGAFCPSRSKSLDQNRNAKKTTIDMSPSLFRIPTSLSQSVLTVNTTNLSCSEQNRSLQTFERASRGVFSLEPAKPLLHQDSSSSNDSNDACTTSIIMDSGLSLDEDSTIWFHPFQGSMVDVPLRGDEIV